MRIPSLKHVKDRPLLGPGWYLVEVAGCKRRISRQSKPYLNFEFKVLDHPGVKLFDIFSLTKSSLWKLRAFIIEAGGNPQGNFDVEELYGRRLYLRISHESFNGQVREKVRQYNAEQPLDQAVSQ